MQVAHRWALYALAALGTAGAMAWVERREAEVQLPAPRRVASFQPPAALSATALPQRRYTEPLGDPFAPDEAVAAAVFASVPAAPMAEPTVLPPPTAPTLPYAYLGRWIENGSTVAFLSTPQGINVAARVGATLDGSYLVEAIDREGIAFKYLPLGQQQRLVFEQAPATAALAAAGTSAQVAAPSDSEESN